MFVESVSDPIDVGQLPVAEPSVWHYAYPGSQPSGRTVGRGIPTLCGARLPKVNAVDGHGAAARMTGWCAKCVSVRSRLPRDRRPKVELRSIA